MTATLMGRLFVVPALVVCVMLGVAVVVVMFGASSIDKPQTLDELLSRIESDPGDKTLGIMLWPGARESWQAAQVLARRLEEAGDRGPPEIEPIARRIIAILEKDRGPVSEGAGRQRGLARRHFLITALGTLKTPAAVEPLVGFFQAEEPQTRQAALRALARMHAVPEARQAVTQVYPLLDDREPAVRMVACLAVAALADRGDAVAIREVARLLEADREIQWNAAQALARLGSKRGKLVLMNMLDRSFWEAVELRYEEDGATVRRRFTEPEIERNLRAALDATAHLEDGELRALATKLRDGDGSYRVREAARVALERMATGSDRPAGAAETPGAEVGLGGTARAIRVA